MTTTGWRKSSRSGEDNCVEVWPALTWHTSSRCVSDHHCVAVAATKPRRVA